MERRDQWGALASSRHIPAAEVGYDRNAGQFGQQGGVPELHSESVLRTVPDRLAVASDRFYLVRLQLCFCQHQFDGLRITFGQYPPEASGLLYLVRPRGVQGKKRRAQWRIETCMGVRKDLESRTGQIG